MTAKERYMVLKEKWKVELGAILGFRNKKAPNQITGHLCDLFFHEKRRQSLLELIKSLGIWDKNSKRELTQTEISNFQRLIEGVAVISRVAASNQKIRVLELRRFCIEFHIFVSTTWPWILWGETFHRLVDHLWEFSLLNYNRGLGSVSEQSLEASHKVSQYIIITSYIQRRAKMGVIYILHCPSVGPVRFLKIFKIFEICFVHNICPDHYFTVAVLVSVEMTILFNMNQ